MKVVYDGHNPRATSAFIYPSITATGVLARCRNKLFSLLTKEKIPLKEKYYV